MFGAIGVSLWRPYASLSAGTIGGVCVTTLEELVTHRPSRVRPQKGDFVLWLGKRIDARIDSRDIDNLMGLRRIVRSCVR